MVKAVIVFVDVNGKKLDRRSEERDRNYAEAIRVPNVPPLRSVPVVPIAGGLTKFWELARFDNSLNIS